MVRLHRSFIALALALACGGGGSPTTTTATTGTGTDASTGAPPTSSTGATGTPSEGTAAETSSGSGGAGSQAACLAWYEAFTDSFRPICECDVADGFYENVEACLADATSPPDCMCEVFGGAPESEGMFDCYEKADRALVACLEAIGACPDGGPLQACYDQEGVAIEACGFPSGAVCEQVFTTCGESGPFGSCAPP